MADLEQIIVAIFDEEYDIANVKKIVRARQGSSSFDYSGPNLGISSGCSVRIFEALNSFVNAKKGSATTKVNPVAKARLILAIHEVEDMFVAYAEDTIDRVVRDVKIWNGGNSQSPFEIKKPLQISVSLLLNDIQSFADLYRSFRDTHFEYFDIEDE